MKLRELLRSRRGPRPIVLADSLAVGPSPGRPADVEALRRAGFRTIVNLDHEGVMGQTLSPNVEASWAHTFAMQHRRVSTGPLPTPSQVDAFLEVFRGSPRPVYVHSQSVERAGVMAAIALALETDAAIEAVLGDLARVGLTPREDRLRSLVERELARHRGGRGHAA